MAAALLILANLCTGSDRKRPMYFVYLMKHAEDDYLHVNVCVSIASYIHG